MTRRVTTRSGSVFAALAVSIFVAASGCSREIIRVRNADEAGTLRPEERGERTALIVVSGLLIDDQGRSAIRVWFDSLEYDAFFVEFDTDDGLDACVRQLAEFVNRNRLEEYGRLYTFAYILGGWTLNEYVEERELKNLVRVVYDRSPIQERAPRVVLENIPAIIHLVYGRAVADLRDTPYPPIDTRDREVGLVIESRAIRYLRWNEEQVLASGPLRWEPEAFGQELDDFMYVDLDHEDMYHNFDVIGPELLRFFESGRFTAGARRTPYAGDPFE
jgi:hypothetical protein